MKAKGLMLLVAMLMITVVLIGCKKKEQPAPSPKAAADDVQKQAEETKEAMETIKKLEESTEQTTCPVMDGNKINKDVFVEYEGVKVYFCCNDCKAKFEADPEKYAANLPQFKQ